LDKIKVDDEEAVGVEIMRRALESPLRQICENAGVESSIIAQAIREGKDDYGYDARTGEYVNMFKAGIIDPTKVARVAVENACSIAGMILTTEAAVTELPEKDAPAMPPMDPGMGGMGGMM
jgi:chaperonin GroEL